MKINKAKLLVGTLAVAAVAATVGSISGTVAWFQYSTRSTVAYSGAAAHCSENLQIRLFKHYNATATAEAWDNKTDWKADLTIADVRGFIAQERGENSDYNLRPITSGAALDTAGKVAGSFYKSPIYQYSGAYDADPNFWQAADAKDYVDLPIQLRVLDRNGEGDDFLQKKVYLTDLTIAQPSNDTKKNITDALRVSFTATTPKALIEAEEDLVRSVTFSKNGGEVATYGTLDLNADGEVDLTEGYEWDDRTEFVYGGKLPETGNVRVASKEVTTNLDKADSTHADRLIADDSDPYAIKGAELVTIPADENGATINVRIYLEGWQTLEDAAVINGAIAKADIADLDALKGQVATLEVGKTYKTADGKVYLYKTAAVNEEPAVFEEIPTKSAVWNDADFVSAGFNVGMRFTAEAHNANE